MNIGEAGEVIAQFQAMSTSQVTLIIGQRKPVEGNIPLNGVATLSSL